MQMEQNNKVGSLHLLKLFTYWSHKQLFNLLYTVAWLISNLWFLRSILELIWK